MWSRAAVQLSAEMAVTVNMKAHAGDWLETRSLSGGAPRRGQIVRVLGRPGHTRYHVRWDEAHESIVYPADGVSVLPKHQ